LPEQTKTLCRITDIGFFLYMCILFTNCNTNIKWINPLGKLEVSILADQINESKLNIKIRTEYIYFTLALLAIVVNIGIIHFSIKLICNRLCELMPLLEMILGNLVVFVYMSHRNIQ
jgi:hypothetical protein